MQRCVWCGEEDLYIKYHDQEWGVPLYDEQKLFEFLILEGMQAGLSWITILRKRAHMRALFANFIPQQLARTSKKQQEKWLQDPGIIRHARKLDAMINNAKIYLQFNQQSPSFGEFLWQFTDGKVIVNHWRTPEQVPTTTPASKQMAKALKAKGFQFVGETICYAFMQAVGMVNDHLVDCYRHQELTQKV